MINLYNMEFNRLNIKQNNSTLLGLVQGYAFYPRVSHGAIIINAFQAFLYPVKDKTKIATGATRGTSYKSSRNPEAGSTNGMKGRYS